MRFPCTLYESEAAATLLSTDLEAPVYAHEFKTAQHSDTGIVNSWQAESCSWSSKNSGPSLNVWISRPDHFDGGAVQCFGIELEDSEPLLGGESSWFFQATFA